MRKKILLSLLLPGCLAVSAQTNLVTNPGFETWTDGKADGWSSSPSLTPTIESTIVKSGSSALRVEASATSNFSQNITITPGKTYELSFDYYIISGDGTDVRIWSGFKNSTTNSTMASGDMTTLGLTNILRGPNSGYFPNVTGEWQHYTTTFRAPDGYDQFVYQISVYTSSKSVWDNFYLGLATSAGTDDIAGEKTAFYLKNGELIAGKNAEGKMLQVFNMQGAVVLTGKVVDGKMAVANLQNGIYLVRTDNQSQKIVVR